MVAGMRSLGFGGIPTSCSPLNGSLGPSQCDPSGSGHRLFEPASQIVATIRRYGVSLGWK